MTDAEPINLIVAEHGVEPSRIREHAYRTRETVVVEQLPGESFRAFAGRVRAESASLADHGHSVRLVSVLAAGRAQSDTVTDRSLLVRGLASSLGRGVGGVLRLESAGGPERFQLASLALTLDAMLQGTGVAVRHVDQRDADPGCADADRPATLTGGGAHVRAA